MPETARPESPGTSPEESSSPLTAPVRGGGRPAGGGPGHVRAWGPRKNTAEEKELARGVSLRRIGRLFAPYRWQIAVVTLIIVASSIVGLASPFLLRAVLDHALPERNVRL